jgi:hypothetical protein
VDSKLYYYGVLVANRRQEIQIRIQKHYKKQVMRIYHNRISHVPDTL